MKYRCKSCKDVIFSRWPRDFCRCKCGKSFVDMGVGYSRIGGEAEPYNENDQEDNETVQNEDQPST